MITIREYKKVQSLEEAYELNQKKSNRIIGGMIWLKMETLNVGTAIDLSDLGLDAVEETETEFRIGAMTTLRTLETHEGLAAYTNGAMRESVRHIVGVQLRNLATLGGSLYSRFGFSDVLTMFLALDASVELYKGGIVPLCEYAERKKDRDVLVRVIVPKKVGARFDYRSVRPTRTDLPTLTCASGTCSAICCAARRQYGGRSRASPRGGRLPLCHRLAPGACHDLRPGGGFGGADGRTGTARGGARLEYARQRGVSQKARRHACPPRGGSTRKHGGIKRKDYAYHDKLKRKKDRR